VTQINIRVDNSTKQKWEEYIDSTDKFQNLTQLIKYSIHEEMRDEEGIDTDVLDAHTQQLRSEIQELDRSVRALDNRTVKEEEFEEIAETLIEIIQSESEEMKEAAISGLAPDEMY